MLAFEIALKGIMAGHTQATSQPALATTSKAIRTIARVSTAKSTASAPSPPFAATMDQINLNLAGIDQHNRKIIEAISSLETSLHSFLQPETVKLATTEAPTITPPQLQDKAPNNSTVNLSVVPSTPVPIKVTTVVPPMPVAAPHTLTAMLPPTTPVQPTLIKQTNKPKQAPDSPPDSLEDMGFSNHVLSLLVNNPAEIPVPRISAAIASTPLREPVVKLSATLTQKIEPTPPQSYEPIAILKPLAVNRPTLTPSVLTAETPKAVDYSKLAVSHPTSTVAAPVSVLAPVAAPASVLGVSQSATANRPSLVTQTEAPKPKSQGIGDTTRKVSNGKAEPLKEVGNVSVGRRSKQMTDTASDDSGESMIPQLQTIKKEEEKLVKSFLWAAVSTEEVNKAIKNLNEHTATKFFDEGASGSNHINEAAFGKISKLTDTKARAALVILVQLKRLKMIQESNVKVYKYLSGSATSDS